MLKKIKKKEQSFSIIVCDYINSTFDICLIIFTRRSPRAVCGTVSRWT